MITRLLLVLALLLPVALLGCPVDDDDSVDDDTGDDDTGDDDTGDDDTADDDTADDDDTTPPVEPYLTGTVYDITCTDPLAGLRVTFCQIACAFKDTDADGRYVFGSLEPVEGLFDVVGHVNPDSALYTGLAVTFDIPETGFFEAPEVCLPEIGALVPVTSQAQPVEVGGDLVLTLDADEVDWLLGTPEIGAVEVPDTAWQYVDLPDVDVLGVWALYAFGNVLLDGSDPIAVDMPARGDLGPGDTVSVYSMSLEEGGFHEVATATVDGLGTRVVTDPGQGLAELSWIAYGVPL